jgi:hypothetical protein
MFSPNMFLIHMTKMFLMLVPKRFIIHITQIFLIHITKTLLIHLTQLFLIHISGGQQVVTPALLRTNREMFLSTKDLFVIVVSIVLQNSSDPLDPVAENDMQFRGLNLLQK